jgi:predicted nucleic acid-binding protein
MKDKVFFDTNLLIYAISLDINKANKIELLLREPFDFIISTQVINEFVHTCYRKNLLPALDIRNAVEDFLSFFELTIIQDSTILTALDIKERYSFSWYDSLIVGAALENECSVLFSEDMQDGIVINQKLTIKNPF